MTKKHHYLHDEKLAVYEGRNFQLKNFNTDYQGNFENQKDGVQQLEADKKKLYELQQLLFATDNHALLLIFQAMDAAGKDSTISHVFSGMFPQAGTVHSFKVPGQAELDHDYLWRTTNCLPERGRVSIFNRSYYEEILVAKVHPQIVLNQRIPGVSSLKDVDETFWKNRYESIRNQEKHLTQNGTIILKFFLNVSKEEQKKRFVSRIDESKKNWKFSLEDLEERKHWDAYQKAYQKAIAETATSDAPWFVIPADKKWFMRAAVCNIIVNRLAELNLKYPELTDAAKAELKEAREKLMRE
jgi:PPK2 family polyphosphate:nucleotide phosphotransferase